MQGPNDQSALNLKSAKLNGKVMCLASCEWQAPGYNLNIANANDACSNLGCDNKCRFCYQSFCAPNYSTTFCVECDYTYNRFAAKKYSEIQGILVTDETNILSCCKKNKIFLTFFVITFLNKFQIYIRLLFSKNFISLCYNNVFLKEQNIKCILSSF